MTIRLIKPLVSAGCAICGRAVNCGWSACKNLFERYGTRAEAVAHFIAQAQDEALASHPAYSQREIVFLLKHEKVERLDDLLLRRTLMAMLGQVTPAMLYELAEISAAACGLVGRAQGGRD